ncbi:MAG TPA: hypothetical protein VFN28_15940 [Amaricoccus sp.]|nr:hypothetical protein [Amaricoccus sp.]
MDIVKRVGRSATPVVLEQVAKLLDVPEGPVERGLAAAVPGVLAGLLAAARQPDLVRPLETALAATGGLTDLLASHPAAAARRGSDLLAPLVDSDATPALAGSIASHAGLPAADAAILVGLAGAMTLGTLAAEAAARGLDGRGVLDLLGRERQVIAAALPPGIAVAPTAPFAAPPWQPAPVPAQPPRRRPILWWTLGLVLVLLLGWLALGLLAPQPAPPVAEAPAAASTVASADPLVVDGVDVGESVGAALASITATFQGITDVASARAALPRLIEARDRLTGVESAVMGLSDQGRAQLKEMVTASLPEIRNAALRLKTEDAVADVVDPVIDDILAQLTVFAA